MIDQITIDRIINAADIVGVVSQFVNLKKRGVNYVGLCPFHSDTSPSFYVSPSKNICKCFACGEGGTAVHFIMKHEQLSYHEALKYLAKKYNIEIQEREFTDEQKKAYSERESLFILNDFACNYFSNILNNHVEGKSIGLSYFKERGFREDTIKKFRLGYALEERNAMTAELMKNGFKKEYLIKTGLTIDGDNGLIDRFRGRVMFPVSSLSGKVVAFGGRILKKNDKVGKYLNSPESEVYHKGNELYGLYEAKQVITKEDCCFLVEGYTDVISMHQCGIENVVASSGTALTQGQIRLIHRFTSNIIVLYDGDAAGIKAAVRGVDLLLEQGLNVKVVLLPEGEDPDSFSRKQNAQSFKDYILKNETDFIRFKTQLLLGEAGNDPIKKASLINDIVATIAVIPDPIVRAVYTKDCSLLLSVDERMLVDAVKNQTHKKTVTADSRVISADIVNINSANNDIDQDPVVSKDQQRNKSQNVISKFEYAILYYIIRFGSFQIIDEDDVDVDFPIRTVIDFIKFDLERDQFWFAEPLYADILNEAIEKSSTSNFNPSKYFLAHPNPQISKIAADLLTDKYVLSNIHVKQFGDNLKQEDTPLAEEKNLCKNVPRVLVEFKNAHIILMMKDLKSQLIIKQQEGNWDATIAIMEQLKNLDETKKILAKELGERIILRF